MKTKKNFLIVLGVVLLVAWMRYNYLDKFGNMPQYQNEKAIHSYYVSQKILDDKEFTQFVFQNGETALDLLKRTENSTQTQGENENSIVVKIRQASTNEVVKQTLSYYVNGKQESTNPGVYKLKDGDKIEWKLEVQK